MSHRISITQTDRILHYMQTHERITPLEAMQEFGCMRLAARINDLKRKGYRIATSRQMAVNRYGDAVSYASYRLEKDNGQEDIYHAGRLDDARLVDDRTAGR